MHFTCACSYKLQLGDTLIFQHHGLVLAASCPETLPLNSAGISTVLHAELLLLLFTLVSAIQHAFPRHLFVLILLSSFTFLAVSLPCKAIAGQGSPTRLEWKFQRSGTSEFVYYNNALTGTWLLWWVVENSTF